MATLPTAESMGQRPVPRGSGGVASYSPQENRAGQIIAGAGQEIEAAKEIVDETNRRQDLVAAQAGVNALQQTRSSLEFDTKAGFRNVKGGGAATPKFAEDYLTRFNDASKGIAEGLSNDRQRAMFNQHAQVASLQYRSALLEHQSRETEKFNDETANSTINIALQGMATRPDDELNFQTGMAAINGTIDQVALRKGLPPETVKEMKGKYLDASYSTRIRSVMDGIPGVSPANPYAAERLFKQVQGDLGPASQVMLSREIQKGVQQVQQRDLAQQLIYGTRPPVSPTVIAPAATGAPLEAVVRDMESGGKRFGKDGALLTSPKGAQGEMQVMPATSADPGFGVRSAALGPDGKPLPDELARVGRDYLGAMTARYQEPALVLAAYNAGPGQVDKWIQQFGDPRTGQIDAKAWADKIPFAETRDYVTKGVEKLGGAGAAATLPPTANELKAGLQGRVDQARELWTAMYPNDPVGADAAAARTAAYGQMVIGNQQAQEATSRDTLFRGMVGQPNGQGKPQTIDQLLAVPGMRDAWNGATPETQYAIQNHFKAGASDPPRTADTQLVLYKYMGMFSNDRAGFAAADLSPLITVLPHADFDRLAAMQVTARNKADLEADKAINLTHAMSIADRFALKPIGIFTPTKASSKADQERYDAFAGALRDQLERFQETEKRRPKDEEIATMARKLTAQVTLKNDWWFDKDARAFEVNDANIGKVDVPARERVGLTAALTRAAGKPPTDTQVRKAYLLWVQQQSAKGK